MAVPIRPADARRKNNMSNLNDTQTMDLNSARIVHALHAAQQSGIPKYLLLRNYLAEEITSGRLPAGTRLPGEDELAKLSTLSLGTVQRSLRILVEEGRLVRKHGIGTFVADAPTKMQAPFQHCRFVDEATGQLLPIFSKVVRRHAVPDTGPWSAYLPDGDVICIERLFSIADEFVIYTHLYFDGTIFPQLVSLETSKLNGANMKDLLTQEFHHPLARFSEHLSVRIFPDYVCKAIKVKPKTSGGVLEIVAYDVRGDVMYFQDLFIPPNHRRLLITP